MQSLIRPTLAAITAFIATNLDDILVLMLFFSQVNHGFRRRHIVAGQYLGFIGVLLLSVPGFLGGFLIPRPWIGLLGCIPIAMGLCNLIQKDTQDTIQLVPQSTSSRMSKLLHPHTYQVAAITLANGGDNIGIYLPLFASSLWIELTLTVTIFLIMVGLWCAIAHSLAHHRFLTQPLMQFGHRLIPIVLVGLGVYILWENQTYQLFRL